MHRNMNLLVLRHKFQQKSLSIFTNCVDFEVGFSFGDWVC